MISKRQREKKSPSRTFSSEPARAKKKSRKPSSRATASSPKTRMGSLSIRLKATLMGRKKSKLSSPSSSRKSSPLTEHHFSRNTVSLLTVFFMESGRPARFLRSRSLNPGDWLAAIGAWHLALGPVDLFPIPRKPTAPHMQSATPYRSLKPSHFHILLRSVLQPDSNFWATGFLLAGPLSTRQGCRL